MSFLTVGCTTSTITNLTPRQLPRSSTGLYPVEAMFKSNQRTLDHDSMKPLVIFNKQAYPMNLHVEQKILVGSGSRWVPAQIISFPDEHMVEVSLEVALVVARTPPQVPLRPVSYGLEDHTFAVRWAPA